MKQIQLLTFLAFVGLSPLSAQSDYYFEGNKKLSFNATDNIIGDPLFSSEYALTYEQELRARWGWTGSLGYVGRIRGGRISEDVYEGGKQRDYFRMNGFSAATSLRYYFGENHNHRWYVGPYAKYAWSYARSLKPTVDEIYLKKLKTTINIGYQVEIFRRVEVEVYAGLGVKFRNYDWSDGERQNSGDSSAGSVQRAWAITWTVIKESSTALAYPVGLRLGYRF